jgi:hypothetical protein
LKALKIKSVRCGFWYGFDLIWQNQ